MGNHEEKDVLNALTFLQASTEAKSRLISQSYAPVLLHSVSRGKEVET